MHIPVTMELTPSQGSPVVRWSYGVGAFDPGVLPPELEAELQPLLQAAALTVEFDLDEGSVGQVHNLQQIATWTASAMAELEELEPSDSSPEVQAAVDAMLAQPAMLNLIATRDLQPYFEPVCGLLPLREPFVTPIDMPNPLGGPPIAADSVLDVAVVDTASQQASMSWSVRPDPESVAAMIEGVLAQLIQGAVAEREDELRAAMASLEIDVTVQGDAVVDMVSGWPLEVRISRTAVVAMPGQQALERFDEWHYEQVISP